MPDEEAFVHDLVEQLASNDGYRLKLAESFAGTAYEPWIDVPD